MMMQAIIKSNPLRVVRLPNGRRSLLYRLVIEVDGELISVPKGFETDYSSIPTEIIVVSLMMLSYLFAYGYLTMVILLLLPRFDQVDYAGVVHDYLYESGIVPRIKADRIWRVIALSGERHVEPIQAWGCWLTLRLTGAYFWFLYRSGRRIKNDPSLLLESKS